jgi:hypothetical protein
MTLAEYSIGAFAVLNGLRVFAYIPQILCVHRDGNGAVAVSATTWSLFLAANIATVTYALAVSRDLLVAVVFSANALGCLSIVALIVMKRLAGTGTTADGARALGQMVFAGHRLAKNAYDRLARMWRRSARKRLEIELRLSVSSLRSFPTGYLEELAAKRCEDFGERSIAQSKTISDEGDHT